MLLYFVTVLAALGKSAALDDSFCTGRGKEESCLAVDRSLIQQNSLLANAEISERLSPAGPAVVAALPNAQTQASSNESSTSTFQSLANWIASKKKSFSFSVRRSPDGKSPKINVIAQWAVVGIVPAMVCMVFYMYWEKGVCVVGCILAYLGFLTTIQFTVKEITSVCGFDYPAFITTLHFITSALFGLCMMIYRSKTTESPMVCPTFYEFGCFIVPLAAAFAAATLLTNAALLYSSIAYVQIIGSSVPIVSAGVSFLMGIPIDRWVTLATLVVVFGCMLSINGEVKLSWVGTICAFSANVLRAIKSTMTQYIMQSKDANFKKFDPCSLLTWMCFASVFFMAMVSAVGEGLAPWQALMSTKNTTKLWVAILLSCLNAAGLNLFALIVTKELGAVGQQLSGQLKNVLCFFGGIVVFNEVVQLLELAGFAVVLAGVNLYQVFDRQLKKKTQAEASKAEPAAQVDELTQKKTQLN